MGVKSESIQCANRVREDSGITRLSKIIKAESILQQQSVDYGGLKKMHFSPTVFRMDAREYNALEASLKVVHEAVERVLDALAAGDEELVDHFSFHSEFRKFLKHKVGTWQVYSRYDFIFSPGGIPKILELNTSCPAGYFYGHIFNSVAREVFGESGLQQKYDSPSNLCRELICHELSAGFAPGLIAVLYDENDLMIELDLIKKGFESIGRRALIAGAQELSFDGTALRLHGERVSMTFNKFRVTGRSIYGWKAGYKERYAAFLAALDARSFVSVNNFAGMVFGEDKGLLSVLSDSNLRRRLGIKDSVAEYIPWTRRLVGLDSRSIIEKDKFVLKPANDGRGLDVVVGAETDQENWLGLLTSRGSKDLIVQEFVPSIKVPIEHARNGSVETENMYRTLSAFLVNGRFHGVISRVSSDSVTNVGRNGFIQPVVVKKEP